MNIWGIVAALAVVALAVMWSMYRDLRRLRNQLEAVNTKKTESAPPEPEANDNQEDDGAQQLPGEAARV